MPKSLKLEDSHYSKLLFSSFYTFKFNFKGAWYGFSEFVQTCWDFVIKRKPIFFAHKPMQKDIWEISVKMWLYSDCLWRESNFLASTRPVTALCVCVCCIVCVCDCVMVIREPTRKYFNIRTRTRQWPDALKPKTYSLVEGNQTIVQLWCRQLLWTKLLCTSKWFDLFNWNLKSRSLKWLVLKNQTMHL